MPAPLLPSNSPPPITQELIDQVARIFDEAQKSLNNHVKNHVSLYKVHVVFARHRDSMKSNRVKLTGERQFQMVIQGLLNKLLPLKKGEVSADRVVKFLGGYLKFINEKASEQNNDSDYDGFEGTPERFTAFLIKFLSQGLEAKDKNVRYRILQIVAEIAPHLGEIEEELYNTLCFGIIGRIQDKESSVRIKAVISLAKLCPADESFEGDELSILDILTQTLSCDSSADVRRCILDNIPITHNTLCAILERTRDIDSTVRKVVYSQVLAKAMTEGDRKNGQQVIGPAHPHNLTVLQREIIIRNGLNDREPSVRAAASTLLSHWVDSIDSVAEEEDVKIHDHAERPWDARVLSLLALFDLGEGTIAMDALFSLFKSVPESFNKIEFPDAYWCSLTPEKAFLARVFVEHCKNKKDDTALDRALPVVTKISGLIQDTFNVLLDELDLEDFNAIEKLKTPNLIIVSQLLQLAVHLDYSDEIGRRKTLQLITEMLQNESLPQSLVPFCLDILRTLYPKEQDLIKVVVEGINDICDAVFDDDENSGANELTNEGNDIIFLEKPAQKLPHARRSLQDISVERKSQVEHVEFKCLNLCIKMLERVNSPFEKNSTLNGMVDDLILPAIMKSKNPIIREMAFKALGLCSLIAKDKASTMIALSMKTIPSSSRTLKITLLQSLFDVLMVHENFVFKDKESSMTLEVVTDFLLTQIREEEDPKVRALLSIGTCKLVISGMITTVEAIQTLIKTYLSPITTDNQELRQSLALFFQIYSHSSGPNQKRMADIFIQVFLDLSEDRKQLEKTDEDMDIIGSAQVAAMFLEWTDPLHLSNAINARGGKDAITVDNSIQLSMAANIIRLLFGKGLTVQIEKEDKKILCQLLNKLYVPDVVDDYKIRSLKLLMDNLNSRRPLQDAVCLNAFKKFEAYITKKFEKQLEGFSEEEFRKLEELNDLFEFLDSIIPLDEEEVEDRESRRKGKKRYVISQHNGLAAQRGHNRSVSRVSRSHSGSPPRNQAKRPRLSKSDDGEEIVEDDRASPIPVAPRLLPKRAAASRKPPQVIVISSDSDEDTREPKAKITHNTGSRFRQTVKTEDPQVDHELLSGTSSLTLGNVSYDSIMDDSIIGDDPDSEEEVNDLLAESD